MDETSHRLLLILGSGGYGATLGGFFGALSGAIYWGSGRAAGTAFGQRVATAFANASDHELSRSTRGALIGATDGFVFLGVCGSVVGALFAYFHADDSWPFLTLAVGGVLLALAAAFFGILAYAVVRNGVWAVVGLFVGGLLGAIGATVALGVDQLLLGIVPGMAVGTLVSFLLRRFQTSWRESPVARPTFEKWLRRSGSEPPLE